MNLYSIDINVIATAYIKAETQEDAQAIAEGLTDSGIELSSRYQFAGDDICVDGRDYRALLGNDEPTALSPAMTIQSLCGAKVVDFVEDLEAEEDEE